MALKLASPLVAAGIGGGTTGVAILVLDKLVEPKPTDTPNGWKTKIGPHKAKASWILGLASAGAIFAITKKKDAAIATAIGATIAGAPLIIGEVKAAIDASKMAPAVLPAPPAASTTSGFGVAVAEARGFGAPPTIELFGEVPRNVQLLGTSSQSSNSNYSSAAFGGGSF